MSDNKKPSVKIPVLMTNETRSRFLSIQAQTGLEGNQVFEHAIGLVYALLPNDRDARVNISQVVNDTLEVVAEKSKSDGE